MESMKQKRLCYLCGVKEANSDDHVPPKCLFPNNAQTKGYKLPACEECNNLLHLDEEYVRDRFTIIGKNEAAHQVFREGTRKAYMRPYEQVKKVNRLNLINRDIFAIKPSTSIKSLSSVLGIKIDSLRVIRVIEKIVKGLYYKHFEVRIPDNYRFEVFWEPKDYLQHVLAKPSNLIGYFEGVFSYKGFITKQDQLASIWWLSFYSSVGLIVVIEGPKLSSS